MVQILVATIDGYFYEYSLNTNVGGECKLERENVLRDSTAEEFQASYLS
jgi:autophagy-related protein 18